jgi:hypothetical protein
MEGQLPNSPSAVPPPAVTPPTPPPPPVAPVAPVVKKGTSSALLVILGIMMVGGIAFAALTLWQQGLLGGFLAKPTPTPTLAPEPTPTPDPTADWKTYTNEKYGFEFKYPSKKAAEFLEEPYNGFCNDDKRRGVVSLLLWPEGKKLPVVGEEIGVNDVSLFIYGEENKENLSTEKWVEKNCPQLLSGYKKENYEISGLSAVKYTRIDEGMGAPGIQPYIFLLKNNKLFYIHPYGNKDIFDQILATFKFLDKESGGSTTEVVKLVGFEKITGWLEYSSATGYSIQHPSSFQPTAEGEEKRDSACYKYFSNNAGGVLTAKVVPYDGGSRRQLYGVESGYTYQYEEVVIQGQKSLLIEKGPIGDSGSESGVVVPVGNKALILSWSNRAKDSSEFISLLKSIKLGESLDLAKCQTL